MTTVFRIIAFSALSLAMVPVLSAYDPKIKLSGRKDRVIPVNERAAVAEVATAFLETRADGDAVAVDKIGNPFAFRTEAPEEEPVETGITVARPSNVVYDDASLLEAVAPTFAAQVRGILARSGGFYLQLAGGRLLTIGDTFPVRLPGLREGAYTIAIADINARGYTLAINDAERYVPLENFGGNSDGAVPYQSE